MMQSKPDGYVVTLRKSIVFIIFQEDESEFIILPTGPAGGSSFGFLKIFSTIIFLEFDGMMTPQPLITELSYLRQGFVLGSVIHHNNIVVSIIYSVNGFQTLQGVLPSVVI